MPVLFDDRDDAGRQLAAEYEGPGDHAVVLGIPRGGIPVGYHLAGAIDGILDAIVVRKLPIPGNPEAGLGAIAPDGSAVLNDENIRALGISRDAVERVASTVLKEVNRRVRIYRGDRPFPDLSGKDVIVTDDGLATGYTMIAAIKMARALEPATVSVAVPVSPVDTVPRVKGLVDHFQCLYVSRSYPFAVASFYRDFHDMADDEVTAYLRREERI